MGSAGDLLLLVLCSLFASGCLPQATSTAAADDDVFCEGLSPDARVVSTDAEASDLAEDLGRCPGLEFNVYWRGTIGVDLPFELTNSTKLWISGESKDTSVVDGAGTSTLFLVSDLSELYLEGMGLSGGYGNDGGAVAASEGASLTLVDCDIFANKASSNGGAIHLDAGSSLTAGGVNFTGNVAEVYGGAIHAQDGSTVATQDGTTNLFHDNTAKVGGAIHAQDSSTVLFGGGGGDVSFSGNLALFQGGAVNLEHSCFIKTDGTTDFTDNASGSSGGAIRAFNGSEVVASGNTTFLNNTAEDDGGAILVTQGATLRTRGETKLINNHAPTDGGAIKADLSSRIQIAGRTSFLNNTVGNFGGAISAQSGATVTTVGEVSFVGNTAKEGGAMHADMDVIVALAGAQLYENNSAWSDGGAIHLTYAASVTITGRPQFNGNTAVDGSGGAIYCASIPQATFKNANFTENSAQWGGAVASFSSGGSATSSPAAASTASANPSDFWTSGTGYDQSDLTPSLTTGAGAGDSSSAATVTSLVPDFRSSDDGSSSSPRSGVLPVEFLGCRFDGNRALEDGGAIYSVAGFDVIQSSHFVMNRAEASGGALVHSGVMEEISDTVFEANGAGNEGPAVLSLGLLSYMSGVTFDDNAFYCGKGEFGTETEIGTESSAGEDTCRFERVCSRCASACDSELQSGADVVDAAYLPACEMVPEGSKTTTRGGTLETLEILPGFYRSHATSTDIRECLHEEACQGGKFPGKYCAEGYEGPYCAVCAAGYSPGYAHTCKSCFGGRKARALGITSSIAMVALLAAAFLVAKLVSVVKTGPPECAQSRWQKKCSEWQARMKKIVPLTAVKIVVVVWQIVTQYSDVAGVEYPGAYSKFLSVIDVVNVDVGFILSLACVYDTDFYDRLLMATICPAFVLGLLGCTYLVARRRNRQSEQAIGVVQRRHLSVALFVMFVVYATVSYTVFQTFVCDTLDDGNAYLRADYSLTCSTSLHTAYRQYAGVMVLVYPVGIPCVFGWWLCKHRSELKEENRASNAELQPVADLWQPYTRGRYYYEVVECFRRIALTGFAVFIHPNSAAQIAIVLLLAAVFMVVSEILAPFARPVEMWLYRAGHYVVFASMYLSLLLRVDVSDENDQSQEVFSGVIVVAHAAMILVVVGQGLLIFIGWGGLDERHSVDASSTTRPADESGRWDAEGTGGERGGGGGARMECRDAECHGRGHLSEEVAGSCSGIAAHPFKRHGADSRERKREGSASKNIFCLRSDGDDDGTTRGVEKKGGVEMANRCPRAECGKFPAPPTRSSSQVDLDVASPECVDGARKLPLKKSPSSPALRAGAMVRGSADALAAYPGRLVRRAMAAGNEDEVGDDRVESWQVRPRSLPPKGWHREQPPRAVNATGLWASSTAASAAVADVGKTARKSLAPGDRNGGDDVDDWRETRPMGPPSLGPKRWCGDGPEVARNFPRKPVSNDVTLGSEAAAAAGEGNAVVRTLRVEGEGRGVPGRRKAAGDKEPTGALPTSEDAGERSIYGSTTATAASARSGGRPGCTAASGGSRRSLGNNAGLPKKRGWALSAPAALPVHPLATPTSDTAAAGVTTATSMPTVSVTPASGERCRPTAEKRGQHHVWSGYTPSRESERFSLPRVKNVGGMKALRTAVPPAVAPVVPTKHTAVTAMPFSSDGISGLGRGSAAGSTQRAFYSVPARRPPSLGRRPNARVVLSPGGSSVSSSLPSTPPPAGSDPDAPKDESTSLAATTLPLTENAPVSLRRPIGIASTAFGSDGLKLAGRRKAGASTQRTFSSVPASHRTPHHLRRTAQVIVSPEGSSMSERSSMFSVPPPSFSAPRPPNNKSRSPEAAAVKTAPMSPLSRFRPPVASTRRVRADDFGGAGRPGAAASMHRTFSSAGALYPSTLRPRPLAQVVLSPLGSSLSGTSSLSQLRPAASSPVGSSGETKPSGAAWVWSGTLPHDRLGERPEAGMGTDVASSMSTTGFSTTGLFRKPENKVGDRSLPEGAAVEEAVVRSNSCADTETASPPLEPDTKTGPAGIFSNNPRLGMISPDGEKQENGVPTGSSGGGGDTEEQPERSGDEIAMSETLPTDADAALSEGDAVLVAPRSTRMAMTTATGGARASRSFILEGGTGNRRGSGREAAQQPHHAGQVPPFTRDFRSPSGSSQGGESAWSFGGLGGGGGGGGGFGGNAKRSFYPEALAPLCSSPAGVVAAATARFATGSAVDSLVGASSDGLASPASGDRVDPASVEMSSISGRDDSSTPAAAVATSRAPPHGGEVLGNFAGVDLGSTGQYLSPEGTTVRDSQGEGRKQHADSFDAEIAFYRPA